MQCPRSWTSRQIPHATQQKCASNPKQHSSSLGISDTGHFCYVSHGRQSWVDHDKCRLSQSPWSEEVVRGEEMYKDCSAGLALIGVWKGSAFQGSHFEFVHNQIN